MMTRAVETQPRGGNIGTAWVEGTTAEAPSRGGYLRPRGERRKVESEDRRTVGGPRRRGGQLRTAEALDKQSSGTVED